MGAGRTPRRAVLLVDLGDEVVAVDVEAAHGEIEIDISYKRPEPLEIGGLFHRTVSPAARLDMTVGARFRPDAPYHYRIHKLGIWPDLSANDRRCPARIAHESGVVVRCQRWRGHGAEVPTHAAVLAEWTDDDERALAD